jgi:hypothetical protein
MRSASRRVFAHDDRREGDDGECDFPRGDLRRHEHARQQHVIEVVRHRFDDEIAGCFADLAPHVFHRGSKRSSWHRDGLERDDEPRTDAAHFGLGDRQREAERAVDEERDDARVGVDVVADVDETLGKDSAEGGADG